MKILSRRKDDRAAIERYDLDAACSDSALNKGLVLCYTLATDEAVQLQALEAEARHEEIGVPRKWFKRYTRESFAQSFASLAAFLQAFDDEDFGEWTLRVLYDRTEVTLKGRRRQTVVGALYPAQAKINLLPLLTRAETATYAHNPCDEKLLAVLTGRLGMSEKRAVLTLQKLATQQDIYDEFSAALHAGLWPEDGEAIHVQGYTAEALNRDYPLSVVGAYNYLIYLREAPQDALADLQNGLPRR